MKKNINFWGMVILIVFFILFYFITTFFLDRRVTSKRVDINTDDNTEIKEETEEESIISSLYTDVRMLYDVVNNKFKVSQDDVQVVGDITYKKVTNFDDMMNKYFTSDGIKSYLNLLTNYFLILDDEVYLAGNLVTYQTYYFRGDNTNIYVIDKSDSEINAIVYEKWTSNNKNTLATIKVVRENDMWLIDNIDILATE